MKLFRAVAVFLVFSIILLCFSGCGSDYKKAYIYFELNEPPTTLDAQTASTDAELLIVRNLYEGLLRKNESGAIVNGAAESFQKNGLTYTFKIRKDAAWSAKEELPLTAHDFVFAFRRAVSPETKAPFASRLFAIANARAIYEGRADIGSLGVIAQDDHTLIITLEHEDPSFEETLTTSVCMPCNEEFFKDSVGKYGLESKYIISNGSYSITKWNKEVFGIRLYKNDYYTGAFEAKNAAVFISCDNEEETPLELLRDENVDITFIDTTELSAAKSEGFNLLEYQNICWVMTISREYPQNMRKCFASAFSSDVFASSLPAGFEVAKSLYPDVLNISEAEGIGFTEYNIQAAKSSFSAIVAGLENKKFPTTSLYYYDASEIKPTVTSIVGHWQQNLSAFINVQPSNNLAALQAELSSSSLSFAVFPVYARSTLAEEYLKNFGISSAGSDYTALQTGLLQNNTLLPIAFQNTSIAYRSAIEEIYSEGTNGYIDFAYIIKIEK